MIKGPVLFEVEDTGDVTPANAPPVPDNELVPPTSLQQAAQLVRSRPNRLARWFWGLLISLIGFFAGVAAWNAVMTLLAQSPILGWIGIALLVGFCLVLLVLTVKEIAAFSRLAKIDRIQNGAAEALLDGSLTQARKVTAQMAALYRAREDMRWGQQVFSERQADVLDADALLALAETTLLAPLDSRAQQEIEAASRQVATITALVPIAFADIIGALTANVRMIRRIAEIYGGRSGTLGAWRLTRQVFAHLVATGAVAIGDDLVGSVAGGGILSKVSRRFGEGIINGALTARVGVAAMEVCRPLPFGTQPKPSVTSIVTRSLAGLFGRAPTGD